ncbi:MAG: hypothetical protein ACREVK_05595 [Gammaproteobacteria bacterium]
MANIQTLSVSLVARTQGFTRGLDTAQRRLSAFSGAMAGIGVAARGFGAIGLAAAAAGLGGLTRGGFQSVDAISDTADRLGLAAKDLQAFQLATELAGGSTSALTSGLSRMETRIGQAQSGVRSAQTAFSSLGLNFQPLAAAGPAEAFRTIADRIAAMGSQTEKAAAAQAIFGRGGVQLLSVLNQGRAGFDSAAEHIKRFGGEITSAGSSAVDLADRKLILVRQAFESIGLRLGQAVAPALAGGRMPSSLGRRRATPRAPT